MLNTSYAITYPKFITKTRASFGNNEHIVDGIKLINSGIDKTPLDEEDMKTKINTTLGCSLDEAKQIGNGVVNIPPENPKYSRKELLYLNPSNQKRIRIVNVNGNSISATEDKGEKIVAMKIKSMNLPKTTYIEFYDYDKES